MKQNKETNIDIYFKQIREATLYVIDPIIRDKKYEGCRFNEIRSKINREYGRKVNRYNKSKRYKFLNEKGILHKGKKEVEEAREILTYLNMPLVIEIARKYAGKGINLEDLIGEGTEGLMIAIEKYDPDHKPKKYPNGIEFSTYCHYWIEQSVKRALERDLRRVIKIPFEICSKKNRIDQIIYDLRKELKTEPSCKQISDRYNQIYCSNGSKAHKITPQHVRSLRDARATSAKIFRLLNEIIDTKNDWEKFYECVDNEDSLEKILSCINDGVLDEREKEIIILRYGLDGKPPRTLKGISRKFCLTRERIRQLEGEALEKLRKKLS